MKKSGSQESKSPSQLIDARIEELGDWRGEMLGRLRGLIHEADPDVVETWKWRGVPVWEHDGMICTGETYKSVVKLTFAKGAALPDPSRRGGRAFLTYRTRKRSKKFPASARPSPQK